MARPTHDISAVTRYADTAGFMSAHDPFDALVLHLEFLGAKEYVVELMSTKHKVAEADAVARAPIVGAHVRLALHYLAQASAGPVEVSFLPGYYAILQLLKIYVLFSDLHTKLASNRHHGASYWPTGPVTRPLPEDAISFGKEGIGSLHLFYRLLTGQTIPPGTTITMGEVYPYMQDIGTEWDYAGGPHSRMCGLTPSVDDEPGGRLRVRIRASGGGISDATPLAHLPALGDQTEVDPVHPGPVFRSVHTFPPQDRHRDLPGTVLNRRYLYFPNRDHTMTAVMPGPLLMPEEFPIVLAFFHLSSVSRYHPEYLEHLRDTRYWPVVAALRADCMYKFLLLFWSYLRQAHVEITRD